MSDVLIVVDPGFSQVTMANSIMTKFLRDDTTVYSPAGTSEIVKDYCSDRGVLYVEYENAGSGDVLSGVTYAIVYFVLNDGNKFLMAASKRIKELGCIGIFIGS